MLGAPGRALTAGTAAVALAGCGVEVIPSEHDRHHGRRPPAPLRPPFPAGEAGACPGDGTDPVASRPRACRSSAQRVIVVSPRDTLGLNELSVRVMKRAVRLTLPGSRARLADSRYTFVLLRLDVVNKLARPARFGRTVEVGRQPQVMLRVGGRWYPEYPEAERGVGDGFDRQRRRIPAGELRSGSVVFGVPRSHARRLASRGNALGVVGFSETGGPLRPRTLGLIRLGSSLH